MCNLSFAQDCDITISGRVIDETTRLPLSFVSIFIEETANGTITDDRGNFSLEANCASEYHLSFSHIGCETNKIFLNILRDTFLTLELSHTAKSLREVVIKGKKSNVNSQPSSSLKRQTIEDNPNQNLSGLIQNENGVYLIKNGNGISKPIIHGLYGNRLTILNNGIAQSGQQWGNDHSPEIDPFSSDKITILKGASAIEYWGGNLGSIILTEPNRIEKEPHLHGQVNYAFETNGRGHSLNTRLEKYTPLFAWRVNGTLKKYGDRNTPDYFLNNTGSEELNFSLQLERSWGERFFLDFYVSTFNTVLGVLRGSHIGNLPDLEEALDRERPFFTDEQFDYSISAPKQKVSHHLAKVHGKYYLGTQHALEFTVASQLNNRKEFDIRRSGRSDKPALDLEQYTFNSDTKYVNKLNENWRFILGNQNAITDNTNKPTGILPLIPDYISWKSGIFSTLSRKKNKTYYKIGLRYDFEYQNVKAFTMGLPREIISYDNKFHNFNGLLTSTYQPTNAHTFSVNFGFATRNPGINELYSNGLHQGVSGIEEGDPNLMVEKAYKAVLEYKWFPSTFFTLSTLFYHQHFKDYIFLRPDDEIRPTIRGAFPVFKYDQTDAMITGFDISNQITLGPSLHAVARYSFLNGFDTKNDVPLIFMPPNRFYGSLTYRVPKSVKISDHIRAEDLEIEINNRWVFEQLNYEAEQDFLPPPPAYNLLGLKLSTNLISHGYRLRCFVKADNLLNTRYRDYLNRQRYFADELGLSITLGLNFKF